MESFEDQLDLVLWNANPAIGDRNYSIVNGDLDRAIRTVELSGIIQQA